MSDELVKRLRDFDPHMMHEWEVTDEAADRIDALTAERDEYKRLALIADTVARECKIQEARAEAAEADNARLRKALTGIKRAAAHRMQNDRRDLHSYYFHTADAALNTGKEVMPPAPVNSINITADIGPGDQAVAGAAQKGAEP